jgi:hypothetical protein
MIKGSESQLHTNQDNQPLKVIVLLKDEFASSLLV